MFAALGVFALSVSESANAQQATMQVYQPGSMQVAELTILGTNFTVTLDLSNSIVQINTAIFNGFGGVQIHEFADLILSNGSVLQGTGAASGVPNFGADETPLMEGHIMRFYDRQAVTDGTALQFDFTVRIYDKAGDGVLFMAFTENPTVQATSAVSPQFFLNTNSWEPTNTPSTDNQGYVAPDCTAAGVRDTAGGLMCEMIPPTPPTCGMGAELNAAMDACICTDPTHTLDGGGLSCSPSETTTPTPPTCAADNRAADCTCPAGEMRQTTEGVHSCVADSTPTPPPNPTTPNCDAESAELMGGVCVCKDGFDELDDTQNPQKCEMIPDETTPDNPAPPETPETETAAASADDDENNVAIAGGIFGGGIALIVLLHYFGGDIGADNFSYSPAFGYSVNESGYSANVGGRVDFRKDEWSAYWSAEQANANGDFGNFRYASGGEYKTDFWQASFSESVQGEVADYDFSLSADLSGGIWSLSPVYRMHSRLEEGETETRNSLNLEGVLRYEDWQITPSAGFGWRRAEDFGDNARFRLEAVREF